MLKIKNFCKRKNKFNAVKTVDGDSKGESNRYEVLLIKEALGQISKLEKQPTVTLQEGFRYKEGERKESSIKYTADFKYFDNEKNKWIVEEYKSSYTRKLADYSIRRRLYKYSIKDDKSIEFIEVIK